jgi:hypothetical protein
LRASVTARWNDGSVKWALLEFAADVPANGTTAYALSAKAGEAEGPVPAGGSAGNAIRSTARPPSVSSEQLTITQQADGALSVTRRSDGAALAHLRVAVRAAEADSPPAGSPAGGAPAIDVSLNHRTFAEQPQVHFEVTLTNRTAEPVVVESAEIDCTPAGRPRRVACSGLDGPSVQDDTAGVPDGTVLGIAQLGPTAWGEPAPFTLRDTTGATREGRLTAAWCAADTDAVLAVLAVRRFAPLHPKGVEVRATAGTARLVAQMVPPGGPGLTLAPGMAASMELALRLEATQDAHGSAPAERAEDAPAALAEQADAEARAFDAPLHAAPDPAWVCATEVLGQLVPADSARFPRYEWLTYAGLDALAAVRETRHEFGQIDYGDWSYDRYPRGWGNVEYDLPHALFLLYARSGERRFFEWAVDTARHFRDVDVNHGGHPDLPAGAPHVHTTDHAARGNDLGHTWLEGLLNWHCLTGDRRALETARGIADFCIEAAARTEFAKRSERGMGWLLICLTETYGITGERRYLDGCAPIVEQAVAWQDPAAGNWPNPIGECRNTPKCVGGKPFMVGMVLEGLRRYHEVTGDVRVGDAIVRAARWLVSDGVWVPRDHGFVYATCHQFLGAGRTGEIRELDGLLYAHQLTGEQRFLDVTLDAWDAALRPVGEPYRFDGKGYATMTRSTPYVLACLARLAPDRVW